jgi:transposase
MKLNQNQILKVIELIDMNMSCRRIAQIFDINNSAIVRIKQKYFQQRELELENSE